MVTSMLLKVGLAAILGLIAVAGFAGYMVHQAHKGGFSTSLGNHGLSPRGSGYGKVGAGHHPIDDSLGTGVNESTSINRPGNAGIGGRGNPPGRSSGIQCGSVPPGSLINELFAYHDKFRYELYIYPDNMSIKWIINADNSELRNVLINHIEQMECIISKGGEPRPQDPLFRVDAEISAKYVNTTIVPINSTAVAVIKKAANNCAFEVIKLHAEVVKGFFDTGRIEASKIHEIPDNVYEVCEPYLERQDQR